MSYLTNPGGDQLPGKMKVWRVQNASQKSAGAIASSYGFDDSPDAEILAAGFNDGKECGAAGVSRHGNFLQWGFSAPPSQMTESGRAFFLNSICYIQKYNGYAPLIYRHCAHRMMAIQIAMKLNEIQNNEFIRSIYDEGTLSLFRNDPTGMTQYFSNNYELIYFDGGFKIDQELKQLNILSNRHLSTLNQLIVMLSDPTKQTLAHKLLARYTCESFKKSEEWRAWLATNRSRLYFTDVGGYKFMIAPANYPVLQDRVGLDIPADETWRRVFGNKAAIRQERP